MYNFETINKFFNLKHKSIEKIEKLNHENEMLRNENEILNIGLENSYKKIEQLENENKTLIADLEKVGKFFNKDFYKK